jgi:hypothetical protein
MSTLACVMLKAIAAPSYEGCLGGALPDTLRLIRAQRTGAPAYLKTPFFWFIFALLVLLGDSPHAMVGRKKPRKHLLHRKNDVVPVDLIAVEDRIEVHGRNPFFFVGPRRRFRVARSEGGFPIGAGRMRHLTAGRCAARGPSPRRGTKSCAAGRGGRVASSDQGSAMKLPSTKGCYRDVSASTFARASRFATDDTLPALAACRSDPLLIERLRNSL